MILIGLALQGLWKSGKDVPAPLQGFSNRLYMKATLDGLRAVFYITCIVQEVVDTLLFLPTKLAHATYEARYS